MIRTALSLRRRIAAALALLLTCTASLAQTWTGGGDGTSWNQATNWNALPVSNPSTIIQFNNAGAIITNQNLGNPFQLNYLQHTGAGALTVNGNALEFNYGILQSTVAAMTVNAPIVIVGGLQSYAVNTTINGAISGSGSFSTQSGTTTLTGAGTWSGGTDVNGTLRIAAPNALPAGGAVNLNSLLEFASPTAVSYSGGFQNSGTLRQSGPGTLTLNGNSGGFGGTVDVAAGTLQTTGGSYPLGYGPVTVQSGATLNIASANAHANSTVTVQSGGTLLLGNGAGLQNPTTVQSGGLVQLTANDGLSTNYTTTIAAGGTLDAAGFQQNTPTPVNNAGSVSLPAGSLLTLGPNSTWTGSTAGPGSLTFNAYNINLNAGTSLTHSGGTTQTGGNQTIINGSNVLPNVGQLRISGGNLTHNGTDTVDTILLDGGTLAASAMTATGVVDLQSGTVTGSLTANAAVTKTTSGNAYLAGTFNATAGTTVSGGTLGVYGSGNLTGALQNNANVQVESGGIVAGPVTNGATGTFDVNYNGTLSSLASNAGILNLNYGSTVGGAINSSGTVNVNGATVPNAITSSGLVDVNNYGTQAGPINNSGTVSVTGGGDISGNISGPGTFAANSAYANLTGTNSYNGGSTATNSTVVGHTDGIQGNWSLTASQLQFNQNTPGTMAGNITGTGSVLLDGTGKVTLSGTNNYDGGVNLQASGAHLGIGSNTAAGVGGAITGNNYKLSAEGGARTVANPLTFGYAKTEFTGSDNLTFTNTGAKSLSGNAEILHTSTATTSVAGAFLGQNTTTINVNAGTLRLGALVNNGFRMEGAINVAGGAILEMLSNSPVKLGPTNLAGGTLIAPSGVAVPTGLALTANGNIQGRVSSEAGSLIEATGSLTLGDSASFAGFFSNGELRTQQYAITMLDKNQAVLGSLTELGTPTLSGVLTAANGVYVDFGRAITGYGTVAGNNLLADATIINGDAAGSSVTQQLDFTGYVKGLGTFSDVTFSGTFSPGLSPAIVPLNNVSLGNSAVLVIEIGGLSPGSQHDQIDIGGVLALKGTLDVDLINGFNPSLGNVFNIFDGTTSGTFNNFSFPALGGGLSWDTSTLYTLGNLVVVPEPSSGVLALIAAGLLARRRTARA